MDANVRQVNRLDGAEAQRFRDMLSSSSFGLLRMRIEGEIERARTACERSDDQRETTRAQGAVHALRSVLDLPKIILREMEQRPKSS